MTSPKPAPDEGNKVNWQKMLSVKDIKSLAGYVDVLIEMDFEARRAKGKKNQS